MDEAAVRALARRFVPGRGEPGLLALQSGLVNASYRVTRDGQDFALRLRAAGGEAPGVDRDWERRVLERVSDAQLAPPMVVCLPAQGVLVTRWVEGESWSAAQTSKPAVSKQVAALARAVHGVPAPQPGRAMNPARWRDLYLDALSSAGLEDSRRSMLREWNERAQRLLDEYAAFEPCIACLCHSDLHRHNIVLGDDGLVLLDWEYAHVGDPYWDLAGWVSCSDLPAAAAEQLLSAYLQRVPQAAERRRLQVLSGAYDYICLLWIELSGAMSDDLRARSQVLAARFVLHGAA